MNGKVVLFGLLYFSISVGFFALLIITEETEVRRELCVDGDGDINLEGIMCKKEYRTYLGLNEEMSKIHIPLLTFIAGTGGVIGIIVINLGMFVFRKEKGKRRTNV